MTDGVARREPGGPGLGQSPHLPRRDEVEDVCGRLSGFIRRTPTIEMEQGVLASVPLILKLEMLQVTGTFKARGAFAELLAGDVPDAGVACASGGNFGLALAHAATRLGHRSTVFVPSTSPPAKIDGLGRLGADVVLVDGVYADALAASEEFIVATGARRAHAYDLPGNILGAATIGAEIEEQVGCPTALLVAVGGGGLVAGLASWFRDRCRILAVETRKCPTLHRALRAGRPVDVEVGGVAASSLGARVIGEHCWGARRWIDDSVLVEDHAVTEAQHALWREVRLATEPAGAAALAAVRSGAVSPGSLGDRVVVLVCGANVDPSTLSSMDRSSGDDQVTNAPGRPGMGRDG